MLILIFLIITNILTISTAIIDFKDKQEESENNLENERKRSKQAQEQLKKSNSIIEKSNSIIEENKKIMESQQKVFTNTMTVIELQNELNKKNEEIHELQKNVLNNVTGGKSVPQLRIILAGGRGIIAHVINKNNLPVRNVSITLIRFIYDTAEQIDEYTHKMDSNSVKEYNFKIGDLPVDFKTQILEESYTKPFKNFYYRYRVNWQNGYYEGHFSVDDGDKIPYQISNSKIVQYSEGFDLKKAVIVGLNFAEVSSK